MPMVHQILTVVVVESGRRVTEAQRKHEHLDPLERLARIYNAGKDLLMTCIVYGGEQEAWSIATDRYSSCAR